MNSTFVVFVGICELKSNLLQLSKYTLFDNDQIKEDDKIVSVW